MICNEMSPHYIQKLTANLDPKKPCKYPNCNDESVFECGVVACWGNTAGCGKSICLTHEMKGDDYTFSAMRESGIDYVLAIRTGICMDCENDYRLIKRQ